MFFSCRGHLWRQQEEIQVGGTGRPWCPWLWLHTLHKIHGFFEGCLPHLPWRDLAGSFHVGFTQDEPENVPLNEEKPAEMDEWNVWEKPGFCWKGPKHLGEIMYSDTCEKSFFHVFVKYPLDITCASSFISHGSKVEKTCIEYRGDESSYPRVPWAFFFFRCLARTCSASKNTSPECLIASLT